MKIGETAVVFLLALSGCAAIGVAPSQSELKALYQKAARALNAAHYDEALKELDAIDARQPDLAASQNLRGVVLMRQGKYPEAEAALRKALEVEPSFSEANFNLAEIPFLQKNWAEARHRFEALATGKGGKVQGATEELIRFKILLTFLLEGKEEPGETILNQFKLSKESPALYYSKAAIALHRKDEKAAKNWIAAAEKAFSPQLNKLFAESFYEVGWLQRPAGGTDAALEIVSPDQQAAQTRADAHAAFETAQHAFREHDFEGALRLLDQAGTAAPNQAASYNLRGEVLMGQKKFGEAEAAFRKAITTDPTFAEAQYHLAQIPFKQKDYAAARARLEALRGALPNDEKNPRSQLINYDIFMTLLLEGKESAAQKMMEQFKFSDETPALYYAQAAWAFQHGNPRQGNDWIASANKLFSPALNSAFADSFGDLASLGAHPPQTTDASPVPVVAENRAAATPAIASAPAVVTEPAAPVTPSIGPETGASPTGSGSPKESLTGAKKKRRRPTSGSTIEKRNSSDVAKAKDRRLARADSAGRPSATPGAALTTKRPASATSVQEARPPFIKRLARTLFRPFSHRRNKSESNGSDQAERAAPARPETTPVEASRPKK